MTILALLLMLNGFGATESSALEPGTVFQDCGHCPEMVVVPAGTYVMGSPETEPQRDADESPQHAVQFENPFAVSRYEITRGEFRRFVEATGHAVAHGCRVWQVDQWIERADKSWLDPHFEQTDDHPVVCINWHDATAYTDWLSAQTGESYRLTTESAWEYAARGGTTTAYHMGNDPNTLCPYENGHDQTSMDAHPDMPWQGVACRDGFAETAPVGSLKPNPFGLYDVHGNVWEWMQDCYVDSYLNAPTDGAAVVVEGCPQHVYRGGGWSVQDRGRRAANRSRFNTEGRYAQLGLRVMREVRP